MRTNYRDLFPIEYVEYLERELLAYTMERSMARSNERHFQLMATMPCGVLGRCLLPMVWGAMKVQFLVSKLWLILTVRRDAVRAAGRCLMKIAARLIGRRAPGTASPVASDCPDQSQD